MKVKHLSEANHSLHEIKQLSPKIAYNHVEECYWHTASYLSYSDASHGRTSYGQTGYVGGVHFRPNDSSSTYHVIDWHSAKQSRVSFSSIGAEILAAAESADRAALHYQSLQRLFMSSIRLPLTLLVDSAGLYSTISTLHECRDYRLRPTVARLRDSFESGEITMLQWVPGNCNLADALTKRNSVMYRLLNRVCAEGIPGENITDECKMLIRSSAKP